MRVLEAVYPRAYVDLNRGAYELEPALFDGQLPAHVDSKSPRRFRLAPCRVWWPKTNRFTIASCNMPKPRRALKPFIGLSTGGSPNYLDGMHQAYGMAVLLDAHSMPSQAAQGVSHHLSGQRRAGN